MKALPVEQQDWDEAAPRPEALVESLRSFGYSPETALADLLDNSISAKAVNVDLFFVWDGPDSHVAVVDDGNGMTAEILVEAMRPGCMSPLEARKATDLGRFGLGLKTASFSQARELTVLTRSKGDPDVQIRRWNLDLVAGTGQWRLLKTSSSQAERYRERILASGGTAVVWTKCDRLLGDVEKDPEKANDRFLLVAAQVQAHLGMTFHRFLVGRGARKISVNGNAVKPWDPVLQHPATQALGAGDRIPFMGSVITARPYVLPHRSKLSEEQQKLGAGIRGWTAHQGFYVYRNNRLVVAGDWLGAAGAKDEHTKLARIVVDFDASLDLAWQIDVKKSTARPPGVVMDDLRRLATRTRRSAEEVYRYRGNIVPGLAKGTDRPLIVAWEEFKARSGDVRLRLNRKHPLIEDALSGPASQKRAVERVLKFVEETIPTSLIGIRLAEALDTQSTPYETRPDELVKLLHYALEMMTTAGMARDKAIDELVLLEPFSNFPAITESLRDGAT
ncbi:ATP-binding protein [Aeromicrobium sp.]|uniref:ATP-binding protein n=1 Tax=Aeromicrobium sp. TaxID=1871063 RepID=UPI0019C7299B|nr:ATP-binding protein [Aeromicrobium sp.]MBC7632572.1 ATP-binding protein [Aeromicrobium sp.]